MLAKLELYARSPALNLAVAATFVAVNVVGWALGGLGFVQEWGGSFAAVIATAFLVWKTQGVLDVDDRERGAPGRCAGHRPVDSFRSP